MNDRTLHVHLLPSLMERERPIEGIAVVIDILRASSTMVTALHHGAGCVIPCATPEEARSVQRQRQPERVLLGGERRGVRIDEFDLGNSPAEYGPDIVKGLAIAFTTTNGTHALLAAREARSILIGAFLNLTVLVSRLREALDPVHLVCAGTDGVVTGEDVLFAGAVVEQLVRPASASSAVTRWKVNDSAQIALSHWKSIASHQAAFEQGLSRQLAQVMKSTRGGANLLDLGYDHDLTLCSQIDAAPLIPVFNHQTGELTGS